MRHKEMQFTEKPALALTRGAVFISEVGEDDRWVMADIYDYLSIHDYLGYSVVTHVPTGRRVFELLMSS
ncbi:MAG: hypothetical protein HZB29_09950 [Nitrospinae bacterium]|nr:hypothetical protein [Nitrospinota bacterium]